jgi:phosphoesterase RecJ-like protein
MALDVYAQIKQLIDEHTHVLILFPAAAGGDAIGAATGLATCLERLDKRVDIVSPGFFLPSGYRFLERAREIKNDLPHLGKFLLLVDVKDAGLSSLTYDVKGDELRIAITPERGLIGRDRIRTAETNLAYDLIITLGAPDLRSFGPLYENNTELFSKTPIVNIDVHPSNERFGQINLLSTAAASISETVFSLLAAAAPESVTSASATALLAGIIAKTRSFKNDATTPETFHHASRLLSFGADREQVVRHLFRTRTVPTLKLWGYVLEHLQSDKPLGLVWSSVTREAFSRTGASEADAADVMEELIANSPDARVTLLLHEHQKNAGIHALVRTDAVLNARKLLGAFQPTGNERVAIATLSFASLQEAQDAVLASIRTALGADKR